VQRPTKHPIFGARTRLRFFIDEMEKVPLGLWKDIDNVFSNVDADNEGFKIGGAFNPEDRNGPCGIRCEPAAGWETLDKDKDEIWRSARGWDVCRLNAMRSENVQQRKVLYPGLQTYEGVQRIVQNAGGWHAAGVYTMVYAMFPPKGLVSTVVTQDMITGIKHEYLWLDKPDTVGGVDVALEGGDTAFFAVGRTGIARGVKRLDGSETTFDSPRPAALLDQLFVIPAGNTVEVALSVHNFATQLGIRPEHLVIDRTGNGAGVHDLVRVKWDMSVVGVNYSESSTQRRILVEDTRTCYDEYDRLVTELWFAVRKWLQAKSLAIGPFVATDELFSELTGRQYHATDRAKKTRIETKKEYKDRNNDASPDQADALTLFLHAARAANPGLPSLTGDPSGVSRGRLSDTPNAPRVSVTDRLDHLD
jgi:hypothetical protein